MKKARLFLIGLALAASTFLSSCNTCPLAGSQRGKVNHVVLVWLKKSGNAVERQKVIDAARMLKREIPEAETLSVGQMLPSKRPLVDSTYDVGLVMRFANAAAMNRYVENPIHQKAGKDLLMPLAKKLVVYDFVTE